MRRNQDYRGVGEALNAFSRALDRVIGCLLVTMGLLLFILIAAIYCGLAYWRSLS